MNALNVNEVPRFEYRAATSPLHDFLEASARDASRNAGRERMSWTTIGFGAAALALFTLLLSIGPVWLVLFGPFVLIGLGFRMRPRSLWR
jgi:fatty acid desaturase